MTRAEFIHRVGLALASESLRQHTSPSHMREIAEKLADAFEPFDHPLGLMRFEPAPIPVVPHPPVIPFVEPRLGEVVCRSTSRTYVVRSPLDPSPTDHDSSMTSVDRVGDVKVEGASTKFTNVFGEEDAFPDE